MPYPSKSLLEVHQTSVPYYSLIGMNPYTIDMRTAVSPQTSTEQLGHFVGILEHVGHALTYKVLTDDS